MSKIFECFLDKAKTITGYPKTLTKAVYDDNGNRLDNTLTALNENLDNLSDDVAQNLLSVAHYDNSKTLNGITYTNNGDGTVTINGTSSAGSAFELASRYQKTTSLYSKLPIGKYYLSGSNGDFYLSINPVDNNGNEISSKRVSDTGNGALYDIDDVYYTRVYIYVPSGKTFSNVTVYPMLEKGTVAHAYKPYKDSFATNNDVSVLNTNKLSILAKGRIEPSSTLEFSMEANHFYLIVLKGLQSNTIFGMFIASHHSTVGSNVSEINKGADATIPTVAATNGKIVLTASTNNCYYNILDLG